MKNNTLRAAIICTLLMGAGVTLPAAAQVQETSTQTYQIPAGDLDGALRQYATQNKLQLAYPVELVEGKNSSGLSGTYTQTEALRRLLQGSGLEAWPINARTIGLRKLGSLPANETRKAPQLIKGESEKSPVELSSVQVTGSRLLRASVEGPVPVNIYDRERIESSGQTTLSDFLSTLSEVSVSTPENGEAYGGQTSVRLRGLPLGSTLVLINGRRVQSTGSSVYYGSYFDLNNIPTAAIERIEVVLEGSSAIYGSDALAGVVNIVLRKDFDGFQANMRHGMASGINESSIDAAWGKIWERGALSLLASHYKRGALDGLEREVTSSQAYGRLDFLCNPGNVYSVDGSNLQGLGAPSAGIKPGKRSIPGIEDFNAGQLNQCRVDSDRGRIPEAKRTTVLASGSFQVTAGLELFSEFMFTRQEQDTDLGGRTLRNVLVPASNAYNPFGQDVRVSYLFTSPLAARGTDDRVSFLRTLVGARGDMADNWGWEVAAWEARDHMPSNMLANSPRAVSLNGALASSDPASALNLFTTGTPGSDELLRSIYPITKFTAESNSRVINAYIRGGLLELPAGSVDVVLGGEYVDSDLAWNSPDIASYNFNFSRKSSSLFAETRVPILGNPNSAVQSDVLAISSAFRYDRYDDFGSHATSQYALEWRPIESLLLRGSYAESFKAPSLIFLYAPTINSVDVCCVVDPRNGGESVTYDSLRSGNPALDPESGDSYSMGVVWSSRSTPGLEGVLTWWKIRQQGRGTQLDPQAIVNNEASFPGRVTRDPATGAIQQINIGYLNYGELKVSGVDLALSYRISTSAGEFTPRISVTRVGRYTASVSPGVPVTNRLDRASDDAWAPSLKATLGLRWINGPYSWNLNGRYVSDYLDYQLIGPTTHRLGDFWLWDFGGRYDLGQVYAPQSRYFRDSYIQLNVVNAFDSLPKLANLSTGYDAAQYDIRGRFVSVSFGLSF